MDETSLADQFHDSIDPDTNYFNCLYENDIGSNQSNYLSIADYNLSCENSPDTFRIMAYNIRSFTANSESMFAMFSSDKSFPDVLNLNETWYKENTCQEINGYSGYHVTRTGHQRSGGVSVYVKNKYDSTNITQLSFVNENIEICTVKITVGNRSYFILAIYRPHSGTTENFISNLNFLLNSSLLRNKTCVILGDLNLNLLIDNEEINNFSRSMYSYHFVPLVTKPTRFPVVNNHLPSLLDHIWVNDPSLVTTCSILLNDFTDHLPILLEIPSTTQSPVTNAEIVKIKFRCKNAENKLKFEYELENFDWSSIRQSDPDIYLENFLGTLDGIYCRCFPLKTKFVSKTKFQKPWITNEIKTLLSAKSKYFKLLQLNLITINDNNTFKNRVKKIISSRKKSFLCSYFDRYKSNLKKTWNMIKIASNLNSEPKKIKKLFYNNYEVTTDAEICEIFNEYFLSIPTILEQELPNSTIDPITYLSVNSNSHIFLNPVDESECLKIIMSLKNSRVGLDHISIGLFKQYSYFYVHVICDLINICFSTGKFPKYLKIARIVPIHKKGSFSDPNNFRPIAILPFMSKIIEKCIHSRLICFFDQMDILSSCQFGFRSGISTSDAVLDLVEAQYEALNEGYYSLNVFVDFRKAFDTIDRNILLRKLYAYGIRGVAFDLISDYLSNRYQFVSINGASSTVREVNLGVPQGSVLGPLLFLICINDLPNISESFKSVIFADDTTLVFKNSNLSILENICNNELEKFYQWTLSNRLSINVDKTFFNIVTNNHIPTESPIAINLCNQILARKSVITFLGIIFDEKLKFTDHIAHISNKIAKSIGILSMLKNSVPPAILKTLYYSFVYPYISYCCSVWGSTYSVHLQPLIVLQKKVIRIINCASYFSHTNILFLQGDFLKLDDMYRFSVGIYMFKNSNLDIFYADHSYNTRNRDQANPIFQRLTLTQHSIFFNGPTIWNSIPVNIRQSSSLVMFKKQYKKHLIQLYSEQ